MINGKYNRKPLSPDETAYFCEQLALMLNSGMQLNDGLEILSEENDDDKIKAICCALSRSITNEKNLGEAMEETCVFPKYALNMVYIGILSGRLEDVLRGLSEYYESRSNLIRAVRSAVLHPLMLLVMMTAVIIVLVIKVIPMFSDIFSQFDSVISEAAETSVNYAYSAGTTVLAVLLIIIAVSGITALLSNITSIRNKLAEFCSVFPLTQGISRKFEQAKLADAMSMMISSGISPDEALENARPLITNKKLAEQIDDCHKRLIKGEYFSDAVCASGILPKIYARSLKIAYTAGSFDVTWKKISTRCNEEAERTAGALISFIEPAIIAVLAVIIGSIMLTVMLPLMNIVSSLG